MLSGLLLFWVILVAGIMGTGTQTYLALPGQALLAMAALVALFRRQRSGVEWKWVAPCLLALVYLIARAGFSKVAYLAHPDFFLALGAAIAFTLAYLGADQTGFRRGLYVGVLALSLLNVGIGLFHLKDPNFSILPGYSRYFPGDRAGGLFTNPNHLCSFVALTLPLVLAAVVLNRDHMLRRLLLVGVSLGLLVVAFLSLSRAGLIGLGVSLALFVLFLHRAQLRLIRFRIPWWVVATFVVVGSVAVVIVIQVANKRSDALSDTLSQRQQMASTAFSQWKENPAFGTGAGSYRYLSNVYRSSRWKAHVQDRTPEFAHNDWVQLGAEYGLVGLILALLAVGLVFWRIWEWLAARGASKTYKPEVFLVAATSAGMAGVLVHSFFDFNLRLWSHVLLMALFLGLCVRLTCEEEAPAASGRQARAAWALAGLMALLSAFLLSHGSVWRAEHLGHLAARAAAEGEYTVSKSLLTRSLEFEPDHGKHLNRRATNHLGLAYRYSGRPAVKQSYETKALEDYERFAEVSPRDFQGWFSQGLVLTELGRFDAAAHKFEEALRLAPYHRVVQFGYARFLFVKAMATDERAPAEEARALLNELFPRFGSTDESVDLARRINLFLQEQPQN